MNDLSRQLKAAGQHLERSTTPTCLDDVQAASLATDDESAPRRSGKYLVGAAAVAVLVLLVGVVLTLGSSDGSNLATGASGDASAEQTADGLRLVLSLSTVEPAIDGSIEAEMTLENVSDGQIWFGSASCGLPLGAVTLAYGSIAVDLPDRFLPLRDQLVAASSDAQMFTIDTNEKFCDTGLQAQELASGEKLEFTYRFPTEGALAQSGPATVQASVDQFLDGEVAVGSEQVHAVSVPVDIQGGSESGAPSTVDAIDVALAHPELGEFVDAIGIERVVVADVSTDGTSWTIELGTPAETARVTVEGSTMTVTEFSTDRASVPQTSPGPAM